MTTTQTTLSSGTYDNVLAQVEALARRLEPHDYQSGTWLRELAVALAQHGDLVVSVVTYDRGGQELEVRVASEPSSDGIVIGRSASGDQCQITVDLWVAIKGPAEQAASR
jgi:hypothetical protein